jgi:hypothetical protein
MNCFVCGKPVEFSEESAFIGRYAHQACFLESLLKQRDAALEIQKLEKERINVEEKRDES